MIININNFIINRFNDEINQLRKNIKVLKEYYNLETCKNYKKNLKKR